MKQWIKKYGWIILLVWFVVEATVVAVCGFPWLVETREYLDGDWELDDDFDRYEVFIPEENRFYYVPTQKATFIYITDDQIECYCVVQVKKYLNGKESSQELTKFYINLYPAIRDAMGY